MSGRLTVWTVTLDALVAINPDLSLADILALWRLAGPSLRLH